MRWFQVDSDTPHDPKMRAVLKAMGPSGFGGLMLLWCHIANHGEKRPGWSLTSSGKPMPESELITASELTAEQFAQLVSICTENGHFVAREWNTRKVIAIPAMHARADTYTKRRVRTRDAHASKKVPLQDSTNNTNNTNKEIPPTPHASARGHELSTAAATPAANAPAPEPVGDPARNDLKARVSLTEAPSPVLTGMLPRDHVRHAACSPNFAWCVPDQVHFKLAGKLAPKHGGDVEAAKAALLAWYPSVWKSLPADTVIPEAFRFWGEWFDTTFASKTATAVTGRVPGCRHTPPCTDAADHTRLDLADRRRVS